MNTQYITLNYLINSFKEGNPLNKIIEKYNLEDNYTEDEKVKINEELTKNGLTNWLFYYNESYQPLLSIYINDNQIDVNNKYNLYLLLIENYPNMKNTPIFKKQYPYYNKDKYPVDIYNATEKKYVYNDEKTKKLLVDYFEISESTDLIDNFDKNTNDNEIIEVKDIAPLNDDDKLDKIYKNVQNKNTNGNTDLDKCIKELLITVDS